MLPAVHYVEVGGSTQSSQILHVGCFARTATDQADGVRAGAKRLGKKETRKKPMLEEPLLLPDGTFAHRSVYPIPSFSVELIEVENPITSHHFGHTSSST